MDNHFMIGQRRVGIDQPVYIVAEISANHNQDFQQAVRMIQTAKDAGAGNPFQDYISIIISGLLLG